MTLTHLMVMQESIHIAISAKTLTGWTASCRREESPLTSSQSMRDQFDYCFFTVVKSTLSWSIRNEYSSASSSICSSSAVSRPWPDEELVLRRTGHPDSVAACSRAVIFLECAGFTRPSFSPVKNKTAGYLVPSTTRWYGE